MRRVAREAMRNIFDTKHEYMMRNATPIKIVINDATQGTTMLAGMYIVKLLATVAGSVM